MQEMQDATKTTLETTLANRLKQARERKGWTQPHLALVAEVSTSTIGMIESGARQNKGSLPALADALGVRYRWLLHGEEPITNPLPPNYDAFILDEAHPTMVGMTATPAGTAKITRREPPSDDTERRLTRFLAVLFQIPESERAAALREVTETLLDRLPPPPK